MKNFSFLLMFLVFFTGLSIAQKHTVTVIKANGDRVTFNATDVEKIVFADAADDPEFSEEYVDLGLNVKWATCNLGASKPEGYGNYYAWGETEPKEVYNLESYTLYDEEKYWGYKTLGNEITETLYDAAYQNLGAGWRMPTFEEWQELCTRCSWQWTGVNGVTGYKVTGPNGNHIFLPAAGRLYDDELGNEQNGRENISGFYWESSVYENDGVNYRCRRVSFEASGYYYETGDVPFIGMSIRPVYGKLVDTDPEPEPGPMNMVDLGLPSGKKWGGHNVGAAEEWNEGNYYSWGVNRTQTAYGDPAYKWNEGDGIYTDIGQDIAGTQYDVATVRWGEGWRIPNREEFQELIDNCTWTYKMKGAKYGWEVTGTNGNSIFLPMAGYIGTEGIMQGTPGDFYGFSGMYTTSEEKPAAYSPSPHSRYILRLYRSNSGMSADYKIDDTFKSIGVLVRPIHD